MDVNEALKRGKDKPYWTPLESNPDSLNQFALQIGMPKEVAFVDCYGLDPELLAFLPQPVYALVLLYPYGNENIRAAKVAQDSKLSDQPFVKCFWMEQHIGNACGTIAVVHSLLNNSANFEITPGSQLDQYRKAAESLNPADRGYLLGGWEEIKTIHSDAANVGQTDAPEADAHVDSHFVAFTLVDGFVVEFDGGKRSHVVHCPSSPQKFLDDAAAVIKKEYFARDENGNFSIIVLAKNTE